MKKQYYSIRTGKNKNFSNFDLNTLKKLFSDLYAEFDDNGYFQQYFGYDCVDAGFVSGLLGKNIDAEIFRLLRKDNLWTIIERIEYYNEDDLFDVIEFLYDHVSKPIPMDGDYHSWCECGWHYGKFNKADGQKEFLNRINELLTEYSSGFQLNNEGLILIKEGSELETIYDADIPTDNNDISKKMNLSIKKYRQSRSDLEERRIAIRELADVLEELRPDAKKYLISKDESALFDIANNFAIRHKNEKQKTNYDQSIWYSWMFYFYLSTIHTILRLKQKAKNPSKV